MSLLIGKTMEENGIVPSMGSVSSPWDNAVTESLMGVIRAECVHLLRQRGSGARDIRVHRALLQQGQDSLRAWLAQPRGVREKTYGREPLEGGLVPVNEIGADSTRSSPACAWLPWSTPASWGTWTRTGATASALGRRRRRLLRRAQRDPPGR